MNKNILGAAGLLTVGLVTGGAFAITGANAADEPATTTPTSSVTPIVTPLVFTPGEIDDEDEADEAMIAADGSVIISDLDEDEDDDLDDDEGDLDDSDEADNDLDDDLDETELDD